MALELEQSDSGIQASGLRPRVRIGPETVLISTSTVISRRLLLNQLSVCDWIVERAKPSLNVFELPTLMEARRVNASYCS